MKVQSNEKSKSVGIAHLKMTTGTLLLWPSRQGAFTYIAWLVVPIYSVRTSEDKFENKPCLDTLSAHA